MTQANDFSLACPAPIRERERVQLAHGGGGRLMHELIRTIFLDAFGSSVQPHDSAVLNVPAGKIAYTTDSYVVRPMFFPGGDIGTLAVNGTVNDLAMAGARPLYLSAGFILEEGLLISDLRKIVQSMSIAAKAAGVSIVTGDTKVVDRGKGDGVYINTSGVGIIEHDLCVAPASVRPGDRVLINGDLGRHGMAVMAVREGLSFESSIESDTAPLAALVSALITAGVDVRCLRDLTRGGLASSLNEISGAAGLGINIDEARVPVREDVASACEILGLDPLYVANEGRFLAIVPSKDVEKSLEIMRRDPAGQGACEVGSVNADGSWVTMTSRIGARRVLDMLSGEQLPRIC